jgi:hypothetical protein
MIKMKKNQCFIVSNSYISHSVKIGRYYLTGNYASIGEHFLIGDGLRNPRNKESLKDLLEMVIAEGLHFLKEKHGAGGVYFDAKKRNLHIFNDRSGTNDIFVYQKKGRLIVSNRFEAISEITHTLFNDIDIQAIEEFLIFEFPLSSGTFLKHVKYLPPGSEYIVHANLSMSKNTAEGYLYRIDRNILEKDAVEMLDLILDNAMKKIKSMHRKDTVYGLGLSGGIDSRIVAYYAQKNKMRLRTFTFGEPGSDAYYIADKLAKKMGLENTHVGFDKNFIKHWKTHMNHNPMMNLIYAWYYSVYNKLPKFEVLLTGFNGNQLNSRFLKPEDMRLKDINMLVKTIFDQFDEIKAAGRMRHVMKQSRIISIQNELKKWLANSGNAEHWQKKMEFNFLNRQLRFIKNNPSFSFYGKYFSESPFIDNTFMEFILKLPSEFITGQKLQHKLLAEKMPEFANIRPERKSSNTNSAMLGTLMDGLRYIDLKLLKTRLFFKPSHKNISMWLKGNRHFMKTSSDILSKSNPYFDAIFKRGSINELKNNLNTEEDYQLMFRILTVKLWLDSVNTKLEN